MHRWLIFAFLMPALTFAKPVRLPTGVAPVSPSTGTKPANLDPRADFLAAKSLGELGIEQSALAGRFFELMKGALDDEPDLAAAIVLQTDRLVRNEQAAPGGWTRYPSRQGWTQTAAWVRSLLRNSDPVDAAALIIRVGREDAGGRIPLTGAPGFGYDDLGWPLWRRFNALGGNFDTALALDRLSAALRARSGPGTTLFAHPVWVGFAEHLRPAQFRAALAWAESNIEGNGGGDAEIAQQLLLGLRLFETSFPVDWEPADPAPLFDRYVEILEDDTLSLSWRLGLVQFLSEHARHRLPPDLCLACAVVCAKALENDTPAHSDSYAHAMAVFLRAAGYHGWDPPAERIWAGWKHRNRNNAKPNESGLAFDPGRDAVLTMMEVNYVAGNRAAARRTLQDCEIAADAWAGAFVFMVENGDYEYATHLFKEHLGGSFYSFTNYPLDIRASPKLDAALPAYLETIADPQWRLAAEIWLGSTRDPELPGLSFADGMPSRWMNERLSALAPKFGATAPVLEIPRRRSLECLSMSETSLEPILDVLKQQRENLSRDVRNARNGVEIYWLTTVASRWAISSYTRGDPAPLGELWHEVISNSGPYEGHGRDCGEAILDQQSDLALYFGVREDFKTLEPMLPLMREQIATAPDDQYLRDFTQTTTRVLGAHAVCRQAGVFRQWWEKLPNSRQQLLTEGLALNRRAIPDFVRFINLGEDRPNRISTDKRRGLFSAVLSQAYFAGGYEGLPALALAASHGGLTEEDLAVLAPVIAGLAPRAGAAHAEWVGIMAEAGDATRALGALDGGIERAAGDPDLVAQLKLERALLLEHLGRRREALHLLDGLPEEAGGHQPYAETLGILRMRLWDWSLSKSIEDDTE